jgi:hypothetical protein
MTPCANCTHASYHSPIVGCLAEDCTCEDYQASPKTITDAHAERDEAMGRAQQGTEPDWAEAAITAIRDLRDDRPTFTPDDVWDLLTERKVRPPREPRALGPILKAMANGPAATIRPVGFVESRRRHGAPIRVYEARQA